ncbi:SGNH/GDSL hydrolase family protein [Clostridium paraputrificum]|uniref:SGNH/GDSL hydrolase family protein n=1 Tax=Clostridium TaxID=1485 RepID=UPI003D339F25
MNNSKKGLAIIVTLAIVLITVFTFGILRDRKISAKNREDYKAWIEGTVETSNQKEEIVESVVEDTEAKGEAEELNFYGKLKNKKPVRVLILGDGLALSQGRNTDNGIWDQGVASFIQSTYGSTVELKSLAQNGAASAVGYNVVKNNDISNYDFIITCYGQNDNNAAVNIDQFRTNYDSIIKEIKAKNPNGTIVPILPSTLTTDNRYRTTIQAIATEHGLQVADTKTTFINSGIPEGTLSNGVLPNDKGYQLYTETVGNVIKNGVK